MKKNKKLIIFCVVLLIFFLISNITSHIFMSREEHEQRKLVEQVINDNRVYGLKLDGMDYSKESKTMYYQLRLKKGLLDGIFNKDISLEGIEQIRENINQFLLEHPKYFLNDGYNVRITITEQNQAPLVTFSNVNSNESSEREMILDYVYFDADRYEAQDILDLITHTPNIKGIIFDYHLSLEELKSFLKSGTLDYIEMRFNAEEEAIALRKIYEGNQSIREYTMEVNYFQHSQKEGKVSFTKSSFK